MKQNHFFSNRYRVPQTSGAQAYLPSKYIDNILESEGNLEIDENRSTKTRECLPSFTYLPPPLAATH
jgi:hypothetical protein